MNPAPGIRSSSDDRADERKIVTVLFADLARSTELAVQRDPEQLRALLSAFFEEMAQQVRSFGGTVEKYAGDAIMAVFGVPHVHEDDAERGVRAALAMLQGLTDLNPTLVEEYGTQLELRVGVATGEAVASTRETDEFMVSGEVATLAARLQSIAPGVVVCANTHRRLEQMLDGEELRGLVLKGFSDPIMAFRVTGLRDVATRGRGLPGQRSSFVGRSEQLEVLRSGLDALGRGLGKIVSIVGEAGIGKSRLIAELKESAPDGVRWIEGRCEAYARETSHAPFVQIARQLLHLRGGEPATVARTKLRAALEPLVPERYAEIQPVIASLLGVEPGPGQSDQHATSDPRVLHSRLLLTMRALLEAVAARGPIVLVFEDIHWADDASIELLGKLLELPEFAPVMLLMTCRPDDAGGAWEVRFRAQRNHPHRSTEIKLGPLPAEFAERLAEDLIPDADVPQRLRDQIREQSEGNPLFIEEVVRTLIEESVVRREGEHWVVAKEAGSFPIPTTVQAVVAARIDRLPHAAKTVLQHASVVGRAFTRSVLQALEDGDDLDKSLVLHMRAELIRERARLPEPQYDFKHVLTQEAAYASILGSERQQLHRRIALYLEDTAGDPDENSAILAHHWLRAAAPERALDHVLRAGARAARLHAQPEAAAHFWQALELLDALPPTPERARAHVDAMVALVQVAGWAASGDADACLRHLDRAIVSAEEHGGLANLSRLEVNRAALSVGTLPTASVMISGAGASDQDLFQRALEHARESGDTMARAYVARLTGNAFGSIGHYQQAFPLIDEAIELLAASDMPYEHGMSMAVEGRCYSARAGRLDDSLRYALQAREIAGRLEDPQIKAWGAMEAEPYMYMGLWDDVVRVTEEGLERAWDIAEWLVIMFGSAWLGNAYMKLGRPGDAWRLLDRLLREVPPAQRENHWGMIWVHGVLAQYHLSREDFGAALPLADAAVRQARESGFRMDEGAALRIQGEVHAAVGDRAAAESFFRNSLGVLGEIQANPEFAQTLLAHGRFLAPTAEATPVIEHALRLFEEMNAPGWINEARAALSAS